MRFPFCLAVAGALTLGGTSARAEPDAALADIPRPKETKRFYGWQNFIVGYGGAILTVRGFFAGNMLMLGTGVATWGLGGAAVHAAHHNGAAMIASPFIMLGVPYLFYEVGVLSEGGKSYRSRDSGLALGALGVLVAPVIDGLLGWDKVRAPSNVAIAPEVSRERVGLTVLGAF